MLHVAGNISKQHARERGAVILAFEQLANSSLVSKLYRSLIQYCIDPYNLNFLWDRCDMTLSVKKWALSSTRRRKAKTNGHNLSTTCAIQAPDIGPEKSSGQTVMLDPLPLDS